MRFKSFFTILFCVLLVAGVGFALNYDGMNSNNGKSIVVLGSEPEAITGAVTARKLGYDVTLVTSSNVLGGLFVDGMLTAIDLNYDENNNILHHGFFQEFYQAAGNGMNIDLELTKAFFEDSINKYNINVIYNATNFTPIVDSTAKQKVTGVQYTKDGAVTTLDADFVLDGSSEASFTRKLGVPYRKGRSELAQEDIHAAATLVFSVKDVDWKKVSHYLQNDDNPNSGANGNAAWGYSSMYDYPPTNDGVQMRGLNLSRQNDGSVVLNALLVFDVDPISPESQAAAHALSEKELPHIVSYMNKTLVGFETAKLDKVAPSLYIREGVRMVGENTLTGVHVLNHASFHNTIAYGSYPIDLQSAYKGGYGNALTHTSLYSIPLGTMIPKGIENVLLLGRSASFDIVAHGSARTVPVLMSMAEGGVFAIDYSLRHNIPLMDVNNSYEHIGKIQSTMAKKVGFKSLKMPTSALEGKWYAPYIDNLMNNAWFSTGYQGIDYDDAKNTRKAIQNTNSLYIQHSPNEVPLEARQQIAALPEQVSTKDLLTVASLMLDKTYTTLEGLKTDGVIDALTYTKIKEASVLTKAHVYAFLDGLLTKANAFSAPADFVDAVDVVTK